MDQVYVGTALTSMQWLCILAETSSLVQRIKIMLLSLGEQMNSLMRFHLPLRIGCIDSSIWREHWLRVVETNVHLIISCEEEATNVDDREIEVQMLEGEVVVFNDSVLTGIVSSP